MTKKKKIVFAITAMALAAALAIGGTLAYFTDKDVKNNVITMGNVNGDLIENHTPGDGTDSTDGIKYDNVKPNQTLSKEPYIQLAATSEDAYARMSMTITITGTTMTQEQIDAHIAQLVAAIDGVLDANWVKSTDGYYYYQTILSNKTAGANKTSNIFETVTIPSSWGNEIANAVITISLQGELVQADNFTPQTTAANVINGWNGVTVENYVAPTTP